MTAEPENFIWMKLEVLFFQATEIAKINRYVNSKDISISWHSTEGILKNLNLTNLLI